MTDRSTVASTTHTRRATGWPSTGKEPETASTAHTTKTGSAFVRGDDSVARNQREQKWTARDGLSR